MDVSNHQARQSTELKVFISRRDSVCHECRKKLGHQAWIVVSGKRRALCLSCADLDHLTFLPSGNTALTRRAKKHSRLSAVVLKFSRARRRYERQGLLVEEAALAQADAECLADEEARTRQRERAAARRDEVDAQYAGAFAARLRELYPRCPSGREREIAEHACRKYSGRVGRSAAAKQLDESAIRAAVAAHVRHRETTYDQLLGSGWDRIDARRQVRGDVERIVRSWQAES